MRSMRIGWASAALAGLLAAAGPGSAQPPADLDGFWQRTLTRLRAQPLDARVEPVADPAPYRTFRVTFASLDGVRIRARLGVPIGHGQERLPAIVTAPGYGGVQHGVMLAECQRGYLVLQVDPRGQGESGELFPLRGAEKLTWGIERPEGFYYQGAYADLVRGVDYLATREDADPAGVAAVGTSQGGGLVLALAALDPRIRAVVAHVPFLCDFRQAARTPESLVRKILERTGVDAEAALRTLDYFDPLHLAGRIRAPALISAGGKDKTCPPDTIRAVYDRIAARKSLFHDPGLEHTSSSEFYALVWPWLALHLQR